MTPLSALISLERRNGGMWHSGAISVKENNQKDCRIAINSRKEHHWSTRHASIHPTVLSLIPVILYTQRKAKVRQDGLVFSLKMLVRTAAVAFPEIRHAWPLVSCSYADFLKFFIPASHTKKKEKEKRKLQVNLFFGMGQALVSYSCRRERGLSKTQSCWKSLSWLLINFNLNLTQFLISKSVESITYRCFNVFAFLG